MKKKSPPTEADLETQKMAKTVSHVLYLQRVCLLLCERATASARSRGFLTGVPEDAVAVLRGCIDTPSEEFGQRAKAIAQELGGTARRSDLQGGLAGMWVAGLSVGRYATGQGALFDQLAAEPEDGPLHQQTKDLSREYLVAQQVAHGMGLCFGLASAVMIHLDPADGSLMDCLVLASSEGL